MNNFKDLIIFSITSMLERFGFYAMMSILIISLVDVRGYNGEEAGQIYSVFYYAIYISMLLMGLVGDFVNRRKVITVGMVLIAIGYFLYSIILKHNGTPIIIPGVFLILGLGAFKTNLQVQVGDLYKNSIKNGALGYLIFYAFINIGAIFAPFTAIYLKSNYGINTVFLLSGGVTLIALALYYFFPIITKKNDNTSKYEAEKPDSIIYNYAIQTANKISKSSNFRIDKLIGLLFLILIVPFFWIAFHQTGLVFSFYVRDFIDLKGNSPELIQSINPIACVVFTLIVVIFIYLFVKMKSIYSIFLAIGIGMIIVAIGYTIPAFGLVNVSGKLSYAYAIVPLLIITLGELFISPFLILGFYHFSPSMLRGLFMGLYMVITAVGNMLLFKYAIDYDNYGATFTFNKIVIHVLICAAAVFLFWFLIKKLNVFKIENNGI